MGYETWLGIVACYGLPGTMMPFTSANLQRKKFLKIVTGLVNFCIAVSLI